MAYHILLIPALILPLLIYYAVPPKTKERLDAEDRKRAHTKRVASFKEKVAQHLLLNEPYLEKEYGEIEQIMKLTTKHLYGLHYV